nr:histidine kinase [Acidimicrobiia bacterium]
EALANVAKHAGVDRATMFAEADDAGALVCSVTDQGNGFDPSTANRRGLATSVEARMAAIGGSSLVASRPGGGTEVRLEAPTGDRSARREAHR